MRIGLISDTHIPLDVEELPPQLKKVFEGVDLIMHCGDIYSPSVLDELEKIAPVLAARGDDDLPSMKDERVKDKYTLTYEGLSLLVTHVFPYRELYTFLYCSRPSWPSPTQGLEKIIEEIIRKEDLPDILVFADTHQSFLYQDQRVLLVNPGSATMPDYKPVPGTVGILSISDGKAEANIVQL